MSVTNGGYLKLIQGKPDEEINGLVREVGQQEQVELIKQLMHEWMEAEEEVRYLRKTRWGFCMWGLMMGFAVGVVFVAIVLWTHPAVN